MTKHTPQLSIFDMIENKDWTRHKQVTIPNYTYHTPDAPPIRTTSEILSIPRFVIPAKDILAFISSQRGRLTSIYADTEQLEKLKTNTRSPFHC